MQRKLAEKQAKKEGRSVSALDLTCDLMDAGELIDENEDSVMSSPDSQDGSEKTSRLPSNLQII